MSQHRRMEESDGVQRWWQRANPYFHITAFLISGAFIAGIWYTTVNAYGHDIKKHEIKIENHETRVQQLERNYERISESLRNIEYHVTRRR